MVVLWIILAVLAALVVFVAVVVFAGKLRLVVSYSDNNGLYLAAYALFIKIFDTKKTYKKKKHSPKTAIQPQVTPEAQPSKRHFPITDIIKTIKNILEAFFKSHARHLTVRAARINISVSTSDAASTAILYGVVSQGVAYILEILNTLNNLKPIKNSDINISADYISEKTSADIKLIFSFPIKSAILLFFDSEILKLFAPTQKNNK